jgi:hypothetical protein
MPDLRIDTFAITAPTTPGLRDAIGAVCVHWAVLELMVERVAAFQTKQSIEVVYENDFGGNMRLLEKHMEGHPALVESWTELIKTGRELARERHRIVHGLWHVEEPDTIISFFPELKGKGRKIDPDKRMSVDGIHAFKRSVFKLGQRWRRFADPSDDVRLKWSVVES